MRQARNSRHAAKAIGPYIRTMNASQLRASPEASNSMSGAKTTFPAQPAIKAQISAVAASDRMARLR